MHCESIAINNILGYFNSDYFTVPSHLNIYIYIYIYVICIYMKQTTRAFAKSKNAFFYRSYVYY